MFLQVLSSNASSYTDATLRPYRDAFGHHSVCCLVPPLLLGRSKHPLLHCIHAAHIQTCKSSGPCCGWGMFTRSLGVEIGLSFCSMPAKCQALFMPLIPPPLFLNLLFFSPPLNSPFLLITAACLPCTRLCTEIPSSILIERKCCYNHHVLQKMKRK